MPRYPGVAIGTLSSYFVFALVLALLTTPMFAANAADKHDAFVQQRMAVMPLAFAANQGQASSDIRYVAHGPGYSVLVGNDATTLRFDASEAMTLRFVGARATAPTATDPQATRYNYYLGNDPKKWQSNVPTFGKVRYGQLYKGIDAVFYASEGRLEHDFIVAPGADPKQISVAINGGSQLALNRDGNIAISANDHHIELLKPVVYQTIDGHRRTVAANYKLENNKITFQLGKYDRTRELVIDPVVVYGTFIAANQATPATAVAYDGSNVYVGGNTTATTLGAASESTSGPGGGGDIYIASLADSASASAYRWVTFLGGSGADTVSRLRFRNSTLVGGGNSVLAATADFPTTATAFQTTSAGQGTGHSTGVAFMINPATGALTYSTYVSTASSFATTNVNGVDYDGTHLWVGGSSNDLTITAFDTTGVTLGLVSNGYVLRIDPTTAGGGTIKGAVLTGGAGALSVNDIAVNSNIVHAAVTGVAGGGYPTQDGAACTTMYTSGVSVYRIDVTQTTPCSALLGNALVADIGVGRAIANSGGFDYLVGQTKSATGFTGETLGGTADAFIAKVDNTSAVLWQHLVSSTTAGTGGDGNNDIALDVDVDSSGDAAAVGTSDSTNLASIATSADTGNGHAGFLSIFNPAGTAVFQSYLQGNGSNDIAQAVALQPSSTATDGVAWIAGQSTSTKLLTTSGALASTPGTGSPSGFLFKGAFSTSTATLVASALTSDISHVAIGDNGHFYTSSGDQGTTFGPTLTATVDPGAGTTTFNILDVPALPGVVFASPAAFTPNSSANCVQSATNSGFTCNFGTLAATSKTIQFGSTLSTTLQCDEAHGPCTSLPVSIAARAAAAQNGANSPLAATITVVPAADVTATTSVLNGAANPITQVKLGDLTRYHIVSTVAGHNVPGPQVITVAPPVLSGGSAFQLSSIAITNPPPGTSCNLSTLTCTLAGPRTTASTVTMDFSGFWQGATDPTKVLTGGSQAAATTISLDAPAANPSYVDTDPANNHNLSANVTVRREADISLSGAGPATAILGANASYAWTLTSAAGSNTVASVSVPVTFPTSFVPSSVVTTSGTCNLGTRICTFSNFAAGNTATITFTGQYTDSPTDPLGTVAPSATVNLQDAVNTHVDTATQKTTLAIPTTLAREVDISVGALTGPATVDLGAPANYNVTVTSAAASNIAPASSVTLTFHAPANYNITSATITGGSNAAAWACAAANNTTHQAVCSNSAGTMPASSAVQLQLNGNYIDNPNDPLAPATVTATVAVNPAIATNNAAQTTSTANTTLTRHVDVSIAGANLGNVALTHTATYSITASNRANAPATAQVDTAPGVQISVTPSQYIVGLAITSPGWACAPALAPGVPAVCSTTAPLAPGASTTLIFTGNFPNTLDLRAGIGGAITATDGALLVTTPASVATPNATNNSANTSTTYTVTAQRQSQLDAAALTPSSAQVGDAPNAETYTLAVTNHGVNDTSAPGVADNVHIVFTLPANGFVPAIPAGCTATATTMTCLVANVAAGQTLPIAVTGTFAASTTDGTNQVNKQGFANMASSLQANVVAGVVGTNTTNVAAATVKVVNTRIGTNVQPDQLPVGDESDHVTSLTYPTVTGNGTTLKSATAVTGIPSGYAPTFAAARQASYVVTTSNNLVATAPTVCYNATGMSFLKPERVSFASTVGVNTSLLPSSAFSSSSAVTAGGYLPIGANITNICAPLNAVVPQTTLTLVEPANHEPFIGNYTVPTNQLGIGAATAFSPSSITPFVQVCSPANADPNCPTVNNQPTVHFKLRQIFKDADFNQACFSGNNFCADLLTISVSGPGSAKTVTMPSDPAIVASAATLAACPNLICSLPVTLVNTTVAQFTLTVSDQICTDNADYAAKAACTVSVNYSVNLSGATPPPDAQTVKVGQSATFQFISGSTLPPLPAPSPDGKYFLSALVSNNGGTSYVPCLPNPAQGSFYMSCAMAPTKVGGGETAAVLVSTSKSAAAMNAAPPLPGNAPADRSGTFFALLSAFAGVPVVGILLRSRSRKLIHAAVLTWFVVTLVLLMTACGGAGFQPAAQPPVGGSAASTPTGVYSIRVATYDTDVSGLPQSQWAAHEKGVFKVLTLTVQ